MGTRIKRLSLAPSVFFSPFLLCSFSLSHSIDSSALALPSFLSLSLLLKCEGISHLTALCSYTYRLPAVNFPTARMRKTSNPTTVCRQDRSRGRDMKPEHLRYPSLDGAMGPILREEERDFIYFHPWNDRKSRCWFLIITVRRDLGMMGRGHELLTSTISHSLCSTTEVYIALTQTNHIMGYHHVAIQPLEKIDFFLFTILSNVECVFARKDFLNG